MLEKLEPVLLKGQISRRKFYSSFAGAAFMSFNGG